MMDQDNEPVWEAQDSNNNDNNTSQKVTNESSSVWQAFEATWTQSPMLGPVWGDRLKAFYSFRWFMTYPLQRRIGVSKLNFTVGEAVLVVVVAVWLAIDLATQSSEASGLMLEFTFVFAVSTAAHNSIWTFLLGVPFERAITCHKAAAYLNIVLIARHILHNGFNPTGIAILTFFILMHLTSFYLVRRKLFHLFYKAHLVLGVVLFLVGLLHGASGMGFALALWAIDAAYRTFFLSRNKLPRTARMCVLAGGNILRVTIPNATTTNNNKTHFQGISHTGGQYMFVCVPKLSIFEWHPFSISSAPPPSRAFSNASVVTPSATKNNGVEDIALHIKPCGDWTRKLLKLVQKQREDQLQQKQNVIQLQQIEPLQQPLQQRQQQQHHVGDGDGEADVEGEVEIGVLLEGPYGSPTIDLDSSRYQVLVMIAGGIGITPIQSMCNHVLDQHQRGRPLKKLFVVWTLREYEMLGAFFGAKTINEKLGHRLPFSTSRDAVSLENPYPLGSLNHPETIDVRDPNVLHTEIYLTRLPPEHSKPLHPNLQRLVKHSRIDLSVVFDSVHAYTSKWATQPEATILAATPSRVNVPSSTTISASRSQSGSTRRCCGGEGDVRVGVVVCGPVGLRDKAKQMCFAKSKARSVAFDFHAETFEL